VLPLRDRKARVDGEDGCVGALTAQRKLAAAANKELSAMVEVVGGGRWSLKIKSKKSLVNNL
jgi:hypothetical protein